MRTLLILLALVFLTPAAACADNGCSSYPGKTPPLPLIPRAALPGPIPDPPPFFVLPPRRPDWMPVAEWKVHLYIVNLPAYPSANRATKRQYRDSNTRIRRLLRQDKGLQLEAMGAGY